MTDIEVKTLYTAWIEIMKSEMKTINCKLAAVFEKVTITYM